MEINGEVVAPDADIIEFYKKSYTAELFTLLSYKPLDIFYDFMLDFIHFLNEFPSYYSIFYKKPLQFLEICKKSLLEAEKQLYSSNANDGKTELSIKELLTIRLQKLPYCPDIYKSNLSEIDETSLDKFLVVSATIIRVGARRSLEKQKYFKCTECAAEYLCQADPEAYNKLQLPYKCTNKVAKKKKNNAMMMFFEVMKKKKEKNENKHKQNNFNEKNDKTEYCNNRKFEPLENRQQWLDYQEIKIQETFQTLKPGCIPKTMWVIIESSFVDIFKPGDDVILTGILIKRWKRLANDTRPDISLCILANNISLKNHEKNKNDNNQSFVPDSQKLLTFEEEFEFLWFECQGNLVSEIELRNNLIQSICPQIYEKFDIKLALLLTLIGGVTRTINNTRVRGQCHLLLVGEPGTGKSQMLKFAQNLSNRAVFTNGIGSSSAGLTVSFVREGSEWMIEAGALVLSDLGVCCIDEFNLIKSNDYVAIHEAMEQQTISAAKAGLTTKVNARTTILAACNPVTSNQRYDPEKSLVENTGLSSPLISRFDLIFVVVDQVNAGLDEKNCDWILKKFEGKDQENEEKELWDVEQLKKYIRFVQMRFEPNLAEDAQKVLSKYYYDHLRRIEMQGKTTIRALESLVRLSQAHARLMFRDKVEIFDAISVIILMESAFFTGFLEDVNFGDFILLDVDKFSELKERITQKFDM